MHATRLPPHGTQCRGIVDGLEARIHIAQTARRESHSRLVAVLKEAECRSVQGQHDDRAYGERGTDPREQARESCREGETHQAAVQSATLLSGTYVGNTCRHGGEDSGLRGLAPLGPV